MGSLQSIKAAIANLVLHPRGLAKAGVNCRLGYPRRIGGAEHIEFGHNVRIDGHGWLDAISEYQGQRFSPRIAIGNDVAIGRHATITAISRIEIGDGCLFSEGIYISDHSHDVTGPGDQPLVQRPLVHDGDVVIGARTFLGFRACVLPGVVLGEHCIVGAHAVVTKSFPPGSVVAGCPARLLRTL